MAHRFKLFRELASSVRLRPFDTSTPDGRSKERHRRVLLTGGSALLAKVIAVATSLITIPLTLSYLGSERFGLWMTISSFVTILGFADFGIGNGVLNAVADAHGKEDPVTIRNAVSSALVLLTGVALLIFAVLFCVLSSTDWGHFFNVTSALARSEAAPATAIFVGCFALNIPADVVQRLQLGLQEGFVSKLWQLGGSIAGFLGVLVVIYFRQGLPWLLLALAGAPLLVTIVNNIVFFGWMRPDLRPDLCGISLGTMAYIARLGALFFVLQLVVAIAFSSDNFIVARVLGADAVTQYSITAKMFSLTALGLSMFLGPLWPAYGEAIAKKDFDWVKKTLIRSTSAAVAIAATVSLLLLLIGPWILHVWVRRPLTPPFLLLLGLGLWSVMDAAGQSVSMFLNGANVVFAQVVVASVFAVGCLLLKLFFVHRFGVVGVPWATLISYTLLCAVPTAFIIPRIISRARRDLGQSNQPSETLYR
jgi:O-antigen/teichoic acid export membrane protein